MMFSCCQLLLMFSCLPAASCQLPAARGLSLDDKSLDHKKKIMRAEIPEVNSIRFIKLHNSDVWLLKNSVGSFG